MSDRLPQALGLGKDKLKKTLNNLIRKGVKELKRLRPQRHGSATRMSRSRLQTENGGTGIEEVPELSRR